MSADMFASLAESHANASGRTRTIYVLIISFTVVTFLAFINTFDYGWRKKRVEAYSLIYRYVSDATRDTALVGSKLSHMTSEDVLRVKELLLLHPVRTLDEAKGLLDEASRQYSDALVIPIPIFGISIHVNDLGIISGIALILLMLLLKHSLVRELETLKLAWKYRSTSGSSAYSYDALTSSELLRRPVPMESEERRWFVRDFIDVPLLLLFLPFLVYLLIAVDDVRTYEVGIILSRYYAIFVYCCEALFVLLLAIIGITSFLTIRETESFWKSMRLETLRSLTLSGHKSDDPE